MKRYLKATFYFYCATLLLSGCGTKKSPMDEFIDDLMSRMTLQEKIGQLNQQVAGEDPWLGSRVA